MARICLFGASSNAMVKDYVSAAEELGALIAKAGHSVVFGAGGSGLMGAAARGAKEGGASVIGVIPEFLNEERLVFANCDELAVTEGMRDRAALMMDDADAYICMPGGWGTLYELFEALVLKQLYRHNKPIVLLNTNGFYDTLLHFFTELIDNAACMLESASLYSVAATPEEALEKIASYEPPHRSGELLLGPRE